MFGCNRRRGNECPSEYNTGMHQLQEHTRLEWSGFFHLSFYITLQLVLHFSEFAPDETLQAVTPFPVELDRVSPLCLVPVLCLIYYHSVLTDIFCTIARQLLYSSTISFSRCPSWMMQRKFIPATREEGTSLSLNHGLYHCKAPLNST